VSSHSTGPAGDVVEKLDALYSGELAEGFYDEAVTERDHGIQAAVLAESEGASAEMVVAALLHDVGHLLCGDLAPIDEELGGDAHHEEVGARYLARWFDHHVTDPIRLHVQAKRYLCYASPDHAARLSPSSVRSLAVQGGPMDNTAAMAFRSTPHWDDAVQLRFWDDRAKVAGLEVPPFGEFHQLLRHVATRG